MHAWNNRNQQPTWIAYKQFFLDQEAQLENVHPLHKFWGWCHQPHFHMRVQLNIWPKLLRVESPCSPQPCVIPTQQPTPIPSVTTTHLNTSIIMIQGINVLIKMLLPICCNNKHQIHQTCSLCQLYTTSSMKSLAKRNIWYSSSRKIPWHLE